MSHPAVPPHPWYYENYVIKKKEKFCEEKIVDGRMQHDACWYKKSTWRLAYEGMRPSFVTKFGMDPPKKDWDLLDELHFSYVRFLQTWFIAIAPLVVAL